MSAYISGGTVATALVVPALGATPQTYNGYFGAGPAATNPSPVHPYDYFEVTLTTTSTLTASIALTPPIVNNNTILLFNGNTSGTGPSGSGLTFVNANDAEVTPLFGAADVYDNAQGTATLSAVLPAGTYWVKANNPAQGTPGFDSYTINLSATTAGVQGAPVAGGDPTTARNVGTLGATPEVYSDFAGQGDAYNYYEFTVGSNATVNIGFTADNPAGVPTATSGIALYGPDVVSNPNGAASLGSSAIDATTGAASLSQTLAAGTYYLKVDISDLPSFGSEYQLSLSAGSASGTGATTTSTSNSTVSAGAISQGLGTSGATMRFVDTSLEAQAGRLYQAAFGRAPDAAGLAYWSAALHAGTSLDSVAQSFIASPEFQAQYGSLSNTGFVNALYQNVLHRSADPSGLAYWQGALDAGTATQAQVLADLSESPENEADTPPSADAEQAARLYWAALGRAPDSAGLTYYTSQLSNGTATLAQEADTIAASPEFVSRYGSLDNTAFVNQLYLNVLGRAADASGLAAWTNALAGGSSRGSVVTGFSESAEAQARFASVDGPNGILVS